jgi:Uma2 family endonuclease
MSNTSSSASPSFNEPWQIFPLTVRVSESFEEFVRQNPALHVERNAQGELLIMSPTGGESSERNAELSFQLRLWAKQFGGRTFDSSVAFRLPDGSIRSPDASWVPEDHWMKLNEDDRKKFPPIAPYFVVELRSESDSIVELQGKMLSYLDNGVRLGWLIDPYNANVHIYQLGKPIEVLLRPTILFGDDSMPGFSIDLRSIWSFR